MGSRIAGFGRLGHAERLSRLAERTGLGLDDVATLTDAQVLTFEAADHMIENAVGVLGLPMGIALNFRINGDDRLVPMAVEEPSVVAAASSAARLVREGGGFTADADPSIMIGQVHLLRVTDPDVARTRIEAAAERVMAVADAIHPNMARRGGGVRGLTARVLPDAPGGTGMVVHLLVDVGDAMGANAVNSMVEAIAPDLEALSGGEARLRILSNLADQRVARAEGRVPFAALDTPSLAGRVVAERVVEAWALADVDPYRATTHNKGVMNGVDAVALATGQDWRGIEAGAHAFAARAGRYAPLTTWSIDGDVLLGRIALPLAVGIVGGNLECNPRARLALRILAVRGARDLAAVMAAAGLAQNLAALRALVTDGIQRGHMALHARGLALAAGTPDGLAEAVVQRLISSGEIKLHKAREILADLQAGGAS
ncbi:MAG TPA: hydroxymethylglutaryl-CoA reductase, degradative [Candidatus Binatia bacterium]|jgi:hydroxymethylglutaryl-CoA reductase|nr:hydroxymethylglutaryl-CoA reductase, degradative [Candidatus Binatia bacterium]